MYAMTMTNGALPIHPLKHVHPAHTMPVIFLSRAFICRVPNGSNNAHTPSGVVNFTVYEKYLISRQIIIELDGLNSTYLCIQGIGDLPYLFQGINHSSIGILKGTHLINR
jgi:hypothetical protein